MMPFFALSNIKNIILITALAAVGGLGLYSTIMHNKVARLEQENGDLKTTQIVQESVISITDQSQNKNKDLNVEVKKKADKVKKEVSAKDQDEFIKKSDCVFNNFGKKEYDCK